MAFVYDEQQNGAYICTGTVVAPTVVLTAAHCVLDESGGKFDAVGFHIVTGSADWTSAERQVSEVTRTIPYPGFDRNKALGKFGDAALLVLSAPVAAPPISLATPAEARQLIHSWAHAFVIGWGDTYYGQQEPTFGLLWAKTLIEGTQCEGLWGRICVIDFPKTESGVCHGDSGGPLLARSRHGQDFVELGVAQAVFGRCSTKRPGVFLRADLIYKWVRTRIALVE